MPGHRISLSPDFYAEPGAIEDHFYTIYSERATRFGVPLDVGKLTKDAVEAWRKSEAQRVALDKALSQLPST